MHCAHRRLDHGSKTVNAIQVYKYNMKLSTSANANADRMPYVEMVNTVCASCLWLEIVAKTLICTTVHKNFIFMNAKCSNVVVDE